MKNTPARLDVIPAGIVAEVIRTGEEAERMRQDLRPAADVPQEADLAVDHLQGQEIHVLVVTVPPSGRKVEEEGIPVILAQGVRQRHRRHAARL